MINIFMDDLRPCPKNWILARTTLECIDLLQDNQGNINCLSLDHDMSEQDNDGYWLVKQMVALNLSAQKVYFHTGNPTGRENMLKYLEGAIKQGASKSMELHNGPVAFELDWSEGSGIEWE